MTNTATERKFKTGDRCRFQSRYHARDARNGEVCEIKQADYRFKREGEVCEIMSNPAESMVKDDTPPVYLALFREGRAEHVAVREDELTLLS